MLNVIDFNKYGSFISFVGKSEFMEFLVKIYNETSLSIPLDVIYKQDNNKLYNLDEYRMNYDGDNLLNEVYNLIFNHYGFENIVVLLNKDKLSFYNLTTKQISKISNDPYSKYILDENGNETKCKSIKLDEMFDIIVEQYPRKVEDKLYFTIVNKEMYEKLTSRLHTYTDIVWSITNDLIKTPFHTMFNKNRELLFLDITDGTLSYGHLDDFERYYENPRYELLTNERFFILSKELFPKSKNILNQIICEEY